MRTGLALAALALGGLSFAQATAVVEDGNGETTTLLNNIDPSDIAAIPEPEVLGPPIGVVKSVPSISYNAAEETASVLALVTAATDAQTAVLDAATSSVASETAVSKRSYLGGSTGKLQRRDMKYPIDTSNFVRTDRPGNHVLLDDVLTRRKGHSFGLHSGIYQLPRRYCVSWIPDLPDSFDV